MKNSLPVLTTIVAALSTSGAPAPSSAIGAAPPAATTAAGPHGARPPSKTVDEIARPTGNRLVEQAAGMLASHQSVTARLRHQAWIDGVQLYGVGSYWQLGSGESLRVRMELQMAGQDASLLHVSNSRFLWIDRRLPTGRSVTRIDLRQLRTDPKLTDTDLHTIEPGKASWSTIEPGMTMHSGGLSSLLAALGESFSFLPPQAMRLAVAPPLASEASNIPVYAVVGHWQPEKLAALMGGHGAAAEQTAQEVVHGLPERLPHEVLLLLGQADLFPYRVEYRRLETERPPDGNAPAAPYQLSANPIAVLELSDVRFNVAIEAGQFDYSPRDVDWVDRTAEMVDRLRRQRQAELAERMGTGQSR